MTKEEEIELLEKFVASLTRDGDTTYCGDYFANQLPFIRQAIRLDVSPDVYGKTVKEYHREMVQEAKDIVANAEAEAQDIVCKANAKAELIREQIDKAYQDAHKQFAIVANKLDGIREDL